MKPKIYGFVNGGSPGWFIVESISEDGMFLAQHVCSHPGYGPHDIGVTSDWKHDTYAKYYPDGFEVVWIEDAKTDPAIKAAYAKHVAMSKEQAEARLRTAGLWKEPDPSEQPIDPPPVGDAVDPHVADTGKPPSAR